MVARHEMPGMCHPKARPVLSAIARMATEEGDGMIGWREGAMSRVVDKTRRHRSHRSTGRIVPALYQAFHAWLPSFRPSGTKISFLKLTLIGLKPWAILLDHFMVSGQTA
jgi:hypothetical protein